MKKTNAFFGLALSAFLLLSVSSISKSTTANAGWAVASYLSDSEGAGVFGAGAGGAAGAIVAVKAGAEIGGQVGAVVGGPVGVILGAGLGAL